MFFLLIGLIIAILIAMIVTHFWLKKQTTGEITLKAMDEQRLIHWARDELGGNSYVTNIKSAVAYLERQGATVVNQNDKFIVTLH